MNILNRLRPLVCIAVAAILLSGCIESHQIQHDNQTHKATIDLQYSSVTDTSSINSDSLFIIGPHGSRLVEKIEKKANNHVVVTTHPLVQNRAYKLVSSNGIKSREGFSLPRQSFYITHSTLITSL